MSETVLPVLEKRSASGRRALNPWLTALLLVSVVWVAHFSRAHRFGFYEDDYFFAASTLGWGWGDLAEWIKDCFGRMTHGRPIGLTFGKAIPFLIYPIGGLHAVYMAGFAIVAANCLLFHRLMLRCFGEAVALPAALAFCLFPADTTRAMLTHNLILQPSLLFMLLAMHCYVRNRLIGSYVLIAGSLLSYESPVLPFLAAPLLLWRGGRLPWKKWTIHVLVVVAMVLAAAVVRHLLGDDRMVETSGRLGLTLSRIYKSLYHGPYTCVRLLVVRPAEMGKWLLQNRGPMWLLMVGSAIVIWLAFRHVKLIGDSAEHPRTPGCGSNRAEDGASRCSVHVAVDTSLTISAPLRALLVGAVMLVVAYGFAFTGDHYPPTADAGRMTSVHLAATVGGSMLFGALAAMLVQALAAYKLRPAATAALAAYFALLIGFGHRVQRGFIQSHQDQRWFWTQVLRLCPDMGNGTLILVDGYMLPRNPFVLTTSWADPLVLPQVYRFPVQMASPPRLFALGQFQWRDFLVLKDKLLHWSHPEKGPIFGLGDGWPLDTDNLIMLRFDNQRLVRLTGPFSLCGKQFELKDPIRSPAVYPKGPLYDLLIDSATLQGAGM